MKQNMTIRGNNEGIKEIISILMESAVYFELTLQERYKLIKNMLLP